MNSTGSYGLLRSKIGKGLKVNTEVIILIAKGRIIP